MSRLVLFFLLSACSASGPEVLTTYNAGLAIGFVPGAEDRAPATAAAIGALDADVVCLQEV